MRDSNYHTTFKLSIIEYFLGETNLIHVFALSNYTKELTITDLIMNPIDHERLLQSGINSKINEFCCN